MRRSRMCSGEAEREAGGCSGGGNGAKPSTGLLNRDAMPREWRYGASFSAARNEVDARGRDRGRRKDRCAVVAGRRVRGGRRDRLRGWRCNGNILHVPGGVGMRWEAAGDRYVVGGGKTPRV